MIHAVDKHTRYNSLYRDFTEAYINVHTLTREFYPQARKFVERTEPEVTGYVEKISHSPAEQASPFVYQKLVHYMNQFDDFTLMAYKLFGDLKVTLSKSDNFMNRLIDIKLGNSTADKENPTEVYNNLVPELNELITGLKQLPERATTLETKMKKLETDWVKTKEKMH